MLLTAVTARLVRREKGLGWRVKHFSMFAQYIKRVDQSLYSDMFPNFPGSAIFAKLKCFCILSYMHIVQKSLHCIHLVQGTCTCVCNVYKGTQVHEGVHICACLLCKLISKA